MESSKYHFPQMWLREKSNEREEQRAPSSEEVEQLEMQDLSALVALSRGK